MKYIQLTIHTSTAGIEPISAGLIMRGVEQFQVSDAEDFKDFLAGNELYYDYIDPSLMPLADAETTITIYLPDNAQGRADRDTVITYIAELRTQTEAADYGTLDIDITEGDDADWIDNWKSHFHVMRISDRLVIRPTWEVYEPTVGEAVISLDPGAAFGTGTHETTRLALTLLSSVKFEVESDKLEKGLRGLDIGCGSGILGIAALALGVDTVIAADIDELAADTARVNAEANGFADRMTVLLGNVLSRVPSALSCLRVSKKRSLF